jgi:predicted metal-dependent peptidase
MFIAQDERPEALAKRAAALALASLRRVSLALPHLSGLAALVRVHVDDRVPTAGVFASGRLVVNARWLLSLTPAEATFVLAHELLHLALRSHERGEGIDPRIFNIAHDYIINDILRVVLAMPVPAGGLEWEDARHMSAEQIAHAIAAGEAPSRAQRSWGPLGDAPIMTPSSALGAALQSSGLVPSAPRPQRSKDALDVLDGSVERTWFPGESTRSLRIASEKIAEAVRLAQALGAFREALEQARCDQWGDTTGGEIEMISAIRSRYRPAWEGALQRWFDSVVPGQRTYARASRRGSDRSDVVRVGHRREGWILNVVLDTSGSMSHELAMLLGDIGSFCESAGVDAVRVLQCDAAVTSDELVHPDALASFPITGFGGSDMSPALDLLATEPEVESVIVLTDGYISYPDRAPPFAVLWVLTGDTSNFTPTYGQVIAAAR